MATTQTFLAALDALEPLGLPAETLARVLRALAPVLIEQPTEPRTERRRRKPARRRPGPKARRAQAKPNGAEQRTAAAPSKSQRQRTRDGQRT